MTLKTAALATALSLLAVGAQANSPSVVTQNGCTYVVAQVPGHAPTLHLVANPQSMGLPANTGRCG